MQELNNGKKTFNEIKKSNEMQEWMKKPVIKI
jgi:hypothetical protein